MISFDDLPEDNADLARLDVHFPRLVPDSPDGCPVPMDDILEYLRLESPDHDSVSASQLEFIRTAQVAEQAFWIWSFAESDGTQCYVTVSASPSTGEVCTGYDENYYGLSPEQFMVGTYHQTF